MKKTSTAISKADPEAKVVIAGAAGGHDYYINWWDEMFKAHPKAKKYFDISNVHAISSEEYINNYNVKAYRRMLRQNNIKKNIWVTEADVNFFDTKEQNYSQTRKATKKALNSGATKLFNVTQNLSPDGKNIKYAKKKFKKLIKKYNKK